MTRILVVDDEPQLLRALRINLRARGYDVDVAADGVGALRTAAAQPPDLVVLDLGLPGHGRRRGHPRPARLDDDPDHRVIRSQRQRGQGRGPGRRRRRLRHQALRCRRAPGPHPRRHPARRPRRRSPRWRSGSTLSTSPRARSTTADGTQVRLTPTEWHILEMLARNPGKLVSQRQLLDRRVGTGLHRRNPLPAPVPRSTAPQARGRSRSTATSDH